MNPIPKNMDHHTKEVGVDVYLLYLKIYILEDIYNIYLKRFKPCTYVCNFKVITKLYTMGSLCSSGNKIILLPRLHNKQIKYCPATYFLKSCFYIYIITELYCGSGSIIVLYVMMYTMIPLCILYFLISIMIPCVAMDRSQ